MQCQVIFVFYGAHKYLCLRENFTHLPDIKEISISKIVKATCSIVVTCGPTTVAYLVSDAAVPVAVIGVIGTYDKCRNKGLEPMQSLGISMLSGAFSNFPYDRFAITKKYPIDLIQSFLGNEFGDILINQALKNIPLSEQIRNRQTYCTIKSAGISVGGSLRCMYISYTGMRRDYFGIL